MNAIINWENREDQDCAELYIDGEYVDGEIIEASADRADYEAVEGRLIDAASLNPADVKIAAAF